MDQKTLLENVTDRIVQDNKLHALWLNSLSMMENTGARKISKYEDPVHTGIIVLKHAAEEARHAYYLKKLIGKLDPAACPDYSFPYLLAPVETHHYLNRLDVEVCRYLRQTMGLAGRALMHGAYLLVTYSIEVRADMLYGIYQQALTHYNSRVNVKSIIAEEEGHLEEMQHMLVTFHPNWESIAADVCRIEEALFTGWVTAVGKFIA
jgi:rubrerythrin